jgi:basic membrane protein A
MSSNRNMLYAVICIVVVAGGAITAWYLMGGMGPGLPENPYDVAIVFATGGLGDKSFNDGCKAGADKAMTDLGINFTYTEPEEIADYEGFIRGYAEHAEYADPYDLIICIGFDQAEALGRVANDTPDQKFAIVDMFMNPAVYPNIKSLLFNENEGGALVGAMAGLVTSQDHIGFLGGMDIPLINKFLAGYVWGANQTNEGIEYSYEYVGDWSDPATGKSLCDGLYAAGADIIFAAAGSSGLGVFPSCREANASGTYEYPLWAIGVDSPQMYLGTADTDNPEAPTFVITSMLKRVDLAVFNVIEEVTLGTFEGGLWFGSVANGGIDYEINEDLLTHPASIINAVEDLKDDIIADPTIVPAEKYWEET